MAIGCLFMEEKKKVQTFPWDVYFLKEKNLIIIITIKRSKRKGSIYVEESTCQLVLLT